MKWEELQLGLNVFDVAPHQPLRRVDSVCRLLQQDVAGGVANGEAILRILVERDDAGHDRRAVLARNHLRRVAFHVRDKRVGGTQVNADYELMFFCHEATLHGAPLRENAPPSIVHYWNRMLREPRRCSVACTHSRRSLTIRRMPIDKIAITTTDAPAAIGPYTQAIRTGDLVFTSGQVSLDPDTGQLVPGGIAEQTERVIANLRAVLSAAGLGFANVVKTTVFLKRHA